MAGGKCMLINKATGLRNNIKPVIDYDICSGCMNCRKFCPDVCIEIRDGIPLINYYYCKGCGICFAKCPKDAINMGGEDIWKV